MAENAPPPTDSVLPIKTLKKFRKGALVRVKREAYMESIELEASDKISPEYIFEGPGEVLTVKGEYCQVRWRMPVPDTWLRADQLEDWS